MAPLMHITLGNKMLWTLCIVTKRLHHFISWKPITFHKKEMKNRWEQFFCARRIHLAESRGRREGRRERRANCRTLCRLAMRMQISETSAAWAPQLFPGDSKHYSFNYPDKASSTNYSWTLFNLNCVIFICSKDTEQCYFKKKCTFIHIEIVVWKALMHLDTWSQWSWTH